MLFKKIDIVFGLWGRHFLCVQYILRQWRQMVALGELLALFTATQLRIHSSENKILIRYHIVWLLVVIFSQSCNKRSNARLHCFPSDKKRRKQWEGACGWINFQKTRCFFLTTLALMLLSLLVDHSYWKSLQTAETRNVRCHLLGGKYADTNHDARPLEEFLSADFPPHLV